MTTLKERLEAIWRRIREDFLVVLFSLLLILTINYIVPMGLGWGRSIQILPAINQDGGSINWANIAEDSDHDQLPDLIELTPKGEPVILENGKQVGYGTGTDPFKADTDGDLFPDNAENKLGSDPRNWFDPGWVWILWLIFLGIVIYKLYIERPDRLKEYQRNEEMISKGVAGKGGKFAYGSGSIFAKKADELTEEEKKQLLATDSRFQELTGLPEENEPIRPTFWQLYGKSIIQIIVITIVVVAIWSIVN